MTKIVADGGGGGDECVRSTDQALHATRKPIPSSPSGAYAPMFGARSPFNSKLRLKDERKKVLKLSVRKLKDIEDPEVFLRRSVLINNTTRRLQTEIKAERAAKRAECGRSYSPSPYSYFSIERVYCDDLERGGAPVASVPSAQTHDLCAHRSPNCVHCSSDESSSNSSSSSSSGSSNSSSSSDEEEERMSISSDENGEDEVQSASALMKRVKYDPSDSHGGEETINVVDDDSSDLLREVYMPPPIHPPPMITSLEEEDEPMSTSVHHSVPESTSASAAWNGGSREAWVVANAAEWKEEDLWNELSKPFQPVPWNSMHESPHHLSGQPAPAPSHDAKVVKEALPSTPSSTPTTPFPSLSEPPTSSSWSSLEYPSTNSLILSHNASTSTSLVRPYSNSSSSCDGGAFGSNADPKHFTCGQSSMFGELQSVVFNSLIASLES